MIESIASATSSSAAAPPVTNRRAAISVSAGLLATASIITATVTAAPPPASAFDNAVPESVDYSDRTKFPGSPPLPLGVQPNGRLSPCDGGGLNCFSTTGGDDGGGDGGDDENHKLQLWKPPTTPPQKGNENNNNNSNSNNSKQQAMDDLLETIRAYPPGQQRIDKGGFSIITSTPDYLYVQFESMKHGFIDDLEFAITSDKDNSNNNNSNSNGVGVQVRSSSRIGALDLGVNAKRLNKISAGLRSRGWEAPEITKEDYPDYFNTLVFTFDDYIRSVLGPGDCPVPAEPLRCKNPSNINF